MLEIRRKQLADIVYDPQGGGEATRELIGDTLTDALLLDVEFDLTVAAGAANGNLINEQPLTVLPRIQVLDSSESVVDIAAVELRQLTERQSAKALSGVDLASGGVQGPTTFRQQIKLYFSDPLNVNPIDTGLIAKHPKEFILKVTWPGATDALWKAALVDGANDRTFTFANRKVKVCQVHSPVAFAKGVRPLFLPRIKSKTIAAVNTQADLELSLETSNRIKWVLLRSMLSNVTTEGIINRIGFEDERVKYDERIYARTWHEDEQGLYGGATDQASAGMAYFFKNFAVGGKLSNAWSPAQGSKPRMMLDVTGAANQSVRAVYCELAQEPGITRELPAGVDF